MKQYFMPGKKRPSWSHFCNMASSHHNTSVFSPTIFASRRHRTSLKPPPGSFRADQPALYTSGYQYSQPNIFESPSSNVSRLRNRSTRSKYTWFLMTFIPPWRTKVRMLACGRGISESPDPRWRRSLTMKSHYLRILLPGSSRLAASAMHSLRNVKRRSRCSSTPTRCGTEEATRATQWNLEPS